MIIGGGGSVDFLENFYYEYVLGLILFINRWIVWSWVK